MWPMQVGKFSALSHEKGNRSSLMTIKAYSQHYLVSVSDGCSVAIYFTRCYLSSETSKSRGPDTFGSNTARQFCVTNAKFGKFYLNFR